MPQTQGPADVHPIPDARAGERVPLQPLLDEETQDRDCACALSDGEADQDLVPEQEDEAQEGAAGSQGDKRTSSP